MAWSQGDPQGTSICDDPRARGTATYNHYCVGGGGGGYSRPSGPSAAEIAERRRDQQATALNEQGRSAYDNRDFAKAEQLFQRAVQLQPGDQVLQNNLAMAKHGLGMEAVDKGDYATGVAYLQDAVDIQKQLQNPKFAFDVLSDFHYYQSKLQEKLRADHDNPIAAANIKEVVQGLKFTPAPAAGGLDFNDFNSEKPASASGDGLDYQSFGSTNSQPKDAVGGGSPSDQKVARGTFGTNVAKPTDLVVKSATSAGVGSNTKAGDQLKSAAAAGRAGEDLTKNYDAGGARNVGSLAYGSSHSVDLSKLTPAARNDPQIIAGVKKLDALQAKRTQLQIEREELTKQRNAAKDPAAMKKLDDQLQQKNKDYQANLVMITEQAQVLEKRRKFVDATVANSSENKDPGQKP